MTVIFSDGQAGSAMETQGNFSGWYGTQGVITVDPAVAFEGVNSAKVTAQGQAFAYHNWVTPYIVVHARAYFRFDSISAMNWKLHELMEFRNSTNGVDICYASLSKMGDAAGIFWWSLTGANNGVEETVNNASPFTLDPAHWYCIEMSAIISATAGEYHLYVDNVEVCALTGKKTDNFGSINSAIIGMYWTSATGGDTLHFDSVVIADSYIGPVGEPDPTTGTLTVTATQNSASVQASVTVNGTPIGSTPVSATGLTAGTYLVTATYQGVTQTANVSVVAGQTTTKNFDFALTTTGTINVYAYSGGTAIGADVSADGQSGVTPVSFVFPAGTYTITATYQGQTATPQSVTLAAGQTINVTLQFAPIYTLTVLDPVGIGTPTASVAQYPAGTPITLTAQADIGYEFARWRVNGIDGSTNPNLSFTINADTTVQAVFVAVSPLLVEAGGPYSASIRTPTIQFNGGATGGVAPYSWGWDFGDGGFSNAQSPSHVYATSGTFTATLTVTDNSGTIVSDSATVTISALLPPIPLFSFNPASPVVGQAVTFDGSASYAQEPNTTIILYEFRFGDGEVATNVGPTTTHVYATAGAFQVVLTVTDILGQKNSLSKNITVGQPPHLLTINVASDGGAVYVSPASSDGYYPYGTSVDIVPTPDVGYYLERWTDNGVVKPVSSVLTVIMDVDHDIIVTFATIPAQQWSLTISTMGNGRTTPSGVLLLDEGVGATVTAEATQGSMFIKWTLNGSDFGNTATITVPGQVAGTSLTLTAVFVSPSEADFPLWSIPVIAGVVFIGGYAIRGKSRKKR